MLTKEQIEDFANYDYAGKEKNLDNCQGFIDGATWANNKCAARIAELEKEIRDLQFRKEGDAVLLKAANQQIQKERNKMDILQGAYNTAKSHASGLEAENEILRNEQTGLREAVSNLKMTVVDLEADKAELEAEKAELLAVFGKHQRRFAYADKIGTEIELWGDDLKEIVLLLEKYQPK